MDRTALLAAAAATDPSLEVGRARWAEEGWDFAVALVPAGGGTAVLRFPRRPSVAERLVREARLLRLLRDRLPVAVPELRLVGVLDDGETPFSRHELVPGEPMSGALLESPRAGLLRGQLAGVLAAVHEVPVREAVVEGGVDPCDLDSWRGEQEWLVDRAEAELDAPASLVAAWRDWLADDARWPAELSLVHGDLGPPHLLADHERAVLTGVIDWTDARLADPAVDLADLASWADPAAVREVADGDDALLLRARWLATLGPVHTATHGLDTGDDELVALGRRALRALARQPLPPVAV